MCKNLAQDMAGKAKPELDSFFLPFGG